MGLELFIEDTKVSLPPDLVIAMSYSANFIAEVIQPTGSASNQFSLAKTQSNQLIFEGADSINSDTDIPYRKLSARLIQNGRELIQDGFVIMEESSLFYEVVVYGGNLDFFERIQGKKLRDLDLSDFDHIWNFQNVANSRQHQEGYIYPIIDWSDDQAFIDNETNQIDTRTMYHAIFNHTIVERIFSEVNFAKDGDLLDTEEYKNIVIPIVDSIQSDALKDDRETISILQGGTGQRIAQLLTGNSTSNAVTRVPLLMTLDLKDVYQFFTFRTDWFTNLGTFSTHAYLAPVTGRYTIKFTGRTYQTENIFFVSILQLWKVKPSGVRTIVGSISMTVSQVPFEVDTTVTMDEGDFLTPIVVSGGTFPVSAQSYSFIIDPRLEIVPQTAKNIYKTKISAGDNLPEMSQTDYLKSIAKVFGIIFQTNSFTKTVEFRQFKDIYANIPIARDWTKKRDSNNTNKQTVINYHPDNYAQENVFKWSNEVSPTLAEELGEGSIFVADETLPDKTTLIEIPFSATETDKRLVDLDVPIIRFLKLGLPKSTVKPRMLVIRKEVNDVTVTYKDADASGQAGNDIPLCYFQLPGQSFNLGFDDSLIADNYSDFKFFLDKFKKVEAWYNLDENDIAELDFFIPIYDDNFKHYFFISKIEKFVAGRSTKVELIRL